MSQTERWCYCRAGQKGCKQTVWVCSWLPEAGISLSVIKPTPPSVVESVSFHLSGCVASSCFRFGTLSRSELNHQGSYHIGDPEGSRSQRKGRLCSRREGSLASWEATEGVGRVAQVLSAFVLRIARMPLRKQSSMQKEKALLRSLPQA